MRRLLRPRCPLFRVATLLALLAWTALAFGAPLPVAATPDCATGTTMPMVMDGVHAHVPTPDGHGACCHPGCHCLAPFCAALMMAPALVGVAPAAQPGFPLAAPARVAAMSAPPLRPPIT